MKKTLLLTVLLVVISSLTLFSCTDNSDKSNLPDGYVNNLITFDVGETVSIVVPGKSFAAAEMLQGELFYALGKMPNLVARPTAEGTNEIFIGKCDSELSNTAYSVLEKHERESDYTIRVAICSNGQSAAIAYDECESAVDYTELVNDSALRLFVSEFVKANTAINFADGFSRVYTFDILEKQKEKDAARQNAAWNSILTQSDEETVYALKEMYSMFSPKMLDWLADLYDPETGGFYYSNSGRNHEGYLPDIESTAQAIDLLRISGAFDEYADDANAALPDWFKTKLISFVKGLQDPNGYFYHPQWTRAMVDSKISRKSRDLTKGLSLLSSLGASPTYDILDVKGDGMMADGTPVGFDKPILYNKVTDPLRLSGMASAVSKVVPTSGASVPPNIASKEAFTSYLNGLDLKKDSYSIGNELASQAQEIKARDEYLASTGANYRLKDILQEWLFDNCYQTTGHWSPYADYDGLNGFMKISAACSILKIPLKYPEAAARSAIDAITTEEYNLTVCYAYNTWFSINNIFSILNKCHPADQAAAVTSSIKAELKERAPELIRATTEKQSIFLREDGSFSYTETSTSSTSQGMPVAVPGMLEGDINATLICLADTCHQMFSALGYSMPPIFGKADLTRFIDRVEDLGSIIKAKEELVVVEANFDEEAVGAATSSLKVSNSAEGSTFKIMKDPRQSGNVLEFNAVTGGGKRVRLPMDLSVNPLSRCYVFEGEFNFTDTDASTGKFANLAVGPNCYLITFAKYDGKIHLYEQTSDNGLASKTVDLKTAIPFGQWFKIKVEFFHASSADVRIKLYVDDELISVRDNFYDRDGEKLDGGNPSPDSRYEGVDFSVYSYYGARVLLDNWSCYKKNEQYVPSLDPENQPIFNIDGPDRDKIVYDFEKDKTGALPESINTLGSAEVKADDEGNNLSVKGSATMSLPVNIRTAGANATSIEFDLNIGTDTEGKIFDITFAEDGVSPHDIIKYNVEIVDIDGTKYGCIYAAPTGTSDLRIDGVIIPLSSSHKLKIEYYDGVRVALFFLDSNLVASCDVLCQNAKNYNIGKATLNFASKADLSVDNLVCEKAKKNFDTVTKPGIDSVIHDFENGIGVEYSGSVSLVGDTDKYINLGNSSSISFPVNERSVITSLITFSADLSVSASSEVGYMVSFVDESGNRIIAFAIRVKDKKASIHEVTANGEYSDALCYITKDSITSISVLYYPLRDTAYIISGGQAIACTTLSYSEENKLLAPAFLKIEAIGGSGTLTLDNVKFETTSDTFVPRDVNESQNSEDNSEMLTYEGSSNGNIPSSVTMNLLSSGSSFAVREVLKGDKHTKALEFSTRTGRQDALSFALNKQTKDYNVTVFETDFKFTFKPNKISSFQIFLENGDKTAYIINLSKSGNGISYFDLSSLGEVRHRGSNKTIENAEEWHKLRIEYYNGTRDTVRIKTYIDDELVRVSNIFGGSEVETNQPISLITQVRFMSYGDTYADLYVDNTSLIQTNLECKNDPLTDSFEPIEPDPEDPTPDDPDLEEPKVEILDKLPSDYGITLENGVKIDVNYYPGFVRKALTFTIDDGNIAMDTAFLNIVRPAGIKGTFNLCTLNAQSAAQYLVLYNGYEVANHHALHCLPWRADFDYSKIEIKDEIFNSSTADGAYMYKTSVAGLYYIDYRQYDSSYANAYWHPIATNGTYVSYIDSTTASIEAVFGKGSVVGFAYPHGQLNEYVKQYLKDAGYLYARKTGLLLDKTGFALPSDRFAWTYNANNTNLLDMMEKYAAYPDDGELKFFAFGVHSADYNSSWDMLSTFATTYGGRSDEFFYGTNREIFEYEDAIKALIITEESITNNSTVTVYITVNNTKVILPGGTTLLLSEIEPDEPVVPEDNTITFEDDTVGELPEKIASNKNDSYSYISVISDPRNAAEKVLKFYKVNTTPTDSTYVKSSPVVTIPRTTASKNHNTTVFEADFCIQYVEGNSETTYTFYLGERANPAYSFRINVTRDHFSFIDSSNDTSGISSPAIATSSIPGKWFNLRVEFFEGNQNTVKIMVYVDNALIYVSRNFYGPKKTDAAGRTYIVNNNITEFRISTWGDTQGVMLIDNVSLVETTLSYPANPQGVPSGKVYPKTETEDFDVKVLPIKGGANGIITLNTDISADKKTITVLDRVVAKYDLKADIAVVIDKLMENAGVGTNTEEKTPNAEIVDFLNAKLQAGRLKIMNHGLTHVFWADTETGENIDWDFFNREFIGSKYLLRSLFPSQRVLTFVLPGYASIVSQFGEQIYDEVYDVLKDEYIADRYYDGTAANIYDWDWEKTPAHQILPDNDAQTFAVIDSVARGDGRFANLFLYHLDEDANFDSGATNGGTETYFYQRESRLDAICKRIAAYVETGAVWQTNYEDAMLYLREAENANVSITRGETITIVLEDGLDDEIYNYPLSVRVQLDESYEAVKVTQNGNVSYALVKMQNGIYYADLDIVPDSSEAVVEKVDLDDIPEEFLPAEPGNDDDGSLDFGGTDKDDSAWS